MSILKVKAKKILRALKGYKFINNLQSVWFLRWNSISYNKPKLNYLKILMKFSLNQERNEGVNFASLLKHHVNPICNKKI